MGEAGDRRRRVRQCFRGRVDDPRELEDVDFLRDTGEFGRNVEAGGSRRGDAGDGPEDHEDGGMHTHVRVVEAVRSAPL